MRVTLFIDKGAKIFVQCDNGALFTIRFRKYCRVTRVLRHLRDMNYIVCFRLQMRYKCAAYTRVHEKAHYCTI